jgi:hypothetical protein
MQHPVGQTRREIPLRSRQFVLSGLVYVKSPEMPSSQIANRRFPESLISICRTWVIWRKREHAIFAFSFGAPIEAVCQ